MSGFPPIDAHELLQAELVALEHQVLAEREAWLASLIADEEQREHERDVAERDHDAPIFHMPGRQAP